MTEKKRPILTGPKHTVIEQTAAEFAATWYEIGRGQGLTSKWKDARSYARANFEKFILKAVEILISMLGRQDIPDLMKAEIFDAFQERINDPEAAALAGCPLPNIDISKLLPKQERITTPITTVLHNKPFNPYLKVN